MKKRTVRIPVTVEVTVEEYLDTSFVREKVSKAIERVLRKELPFASAPIVIDLKVVFPAMREGR